MDKFRRRARFLCTIAVVLGLHLTAVWLLLVTSRVIPIGTKSQVLEIVFIPRPPSSLEGSPTSRVAARVAPGHRSKANAVPHADVGPQASENNDTPAPIDWASELTRTVREAAPEESVQKSREFGFPRRPAATAGKPPQFGWDYAATHRFESIPEGGLLVHLNDNCVLVFIPFPFAACAIGKKKANGHLFDHMHDPSQPTDENQAR
jgi:hypothetical protein